MENTKYGYTTYGQDVQNYIYLPDDKITVQQDNNTCPACYTTYCEDASTEPETTVIIKDKHNINIKIEQSAANPFLSEMEKNISANVDNLAALQSDFEEHVQSNIQDFTDVRSELTNVNTQLTNVNINVQTNEKNITELSDYVKDFENSVTEKVDDEVSKSLQNKDLMTGAEVKNYVDEAVEQVDVTEQLSSYATKIYVDEKIGEIDVTEQLADYVDASRFEDSEMATAQMFAVLNKDLLYKADKSEFMMYSTLDYVDKQDKIIYNYIDNKSAKLLQISDYEKNTEDTNFALAQIIATLKQNIKESVDNIDLSEFYTKTEVDTMMEAATGVNFSNYYTKSEVDTAISQIDFVDNEELEAAVENKVTVWTGTQAQYDEITEIDDKILYLIKEDESN